MSSRRGFRGPQQPHQLQVLGDEHAPGGRCEELRPHQGAALRLQGGDGQAIKGDGLHLRLSPLIILINQSVHNINLVFYSKSIQYSINFYLNVHMNNHLLLALS